jgi:hypothetical protein
MGDISQTSSDALSASNDEEAQHPVSSGLSWTGESVSAAATSCAPRGAPRHSACCRHLPTSVPSRYLLADKLQRRVERGVLFGFL